MKCFPQHLVWESRLILLHIESVSLSPESKRTFSCLYRARIFFSSHALAEYFCPKLLYSCMLAFISKNRYLFHRISLCFQRNLICVYKYNMTVLHAVYPNGGIICRFHSIKSFNHSIIDFSYTCLYRCNVNCYNMNCSM